MVKVTDAKQMAKILKSRLRRDNVEITHSLALEAIAAMHGHKNWNVASTKYAPTSTPDIEDRVSVTLNSEWGNDTYNGDRSKIENCEIAVSISPDALTLRKCRNLDPTDWVSVNCPLCGDTKRRGAIRIHVPIIGNIQYKCFNCNHNAVLSNSDTVGSVTERRVFYIDTGVMPPDDAMALVKGIKNDAIEKRQWTGSIIEQAGKDDVYTDLSRELDDRSKNELLKHSVERLGATHKKAIPILMYIIKYGPADKVRQRIDWIIDDAISRIANTKLSWHDIVTYRLGGPDRAAENMVKIAEEIISAL